MHRCCRVVLVELAVTDEEPDYRTCSAFGPPLPRTLRLRSARRTGFTPAALPPVRSTRATCSEHQRSRGRHIARGHLSAQGKCKPSLCERCGICGFFVIFIGKFGMTGAFAQGPQQETPLFRTRICHPERGRMPESKDPASACTINAAERHFGRRVFLNTETPRTPSSPRMICFRSTRRRFRALFQLRKGRDCSRPSHLKRRN